MVESVPLNVNGLSSAYSLYVHGEGDQVVSEAIKSSGIWEAYETQLILESLKPGMTFLDVGANIGYFTLLAADKVGETGKVFAFEPEETNFKLLQKNVASAKAQVVTFAKALSNVSGQTTLYLSETNFGDHQIYENMDEASKRPCQLIDVARGDDLLSAVPRVDFIKIDTQGAEYHVLSGLKASILRSLPGIKLLVEFWPHGLRRAGSSAHEVLDFLIALNLPMSIIDHINHQLIPCQKKDLRPWIDEVDQDPLNEGFMNLYIG